jgi:hypothetical protein
MQLLGCPDHEGRTLSLARSVQVAYEKDGETWITTTRGLPHRGFDNALGCSVCAHETRTVTGIWRRYCTAGLLMSSRSSQCWLQEAATD